MRVSELIEPPAAPWRQRQRLAEVFGQVLPEQTSDDTESAAEDGHEAWLRSQVPPHHGG